MSLNHAHRFFEKIESDSEFRKECCRMRNQAGLLAFLREEGLSFTPDEFEQEAILQLFKCQTEEQADLVRQKQYWFRLFR